MELTYKKSGKLVSQKFKEFFYPTVLASMAAQLGTIINGIIVGNLISPHAMAAISACIPLSQITYALAVLISIGSSGLIAIAAGKRANDEANFIFSTVAATGAICAVILGAILIPNVETLPNFLSSAENLRSLMHAYLIVFVWRLPLYLMSFAWQTLIRTDGFAKVVSRGVLFGQITNVALSYFFVSNGFGVTGAGIALICSDIIAISYMLKRYFSSSERTRKLYPVFNDIGKFLKYVSTIIKSGIPTATGTGLISIKIWAIYQILGETGGEDAMTLYAICMACLSVVSMCIAGCNGAMMPIVGMLYGEKDFGGVRILVKYVLKFALTLSGIFVALTIFFPQIILTLYNVPETLFDAGATALRLFVISLLGVTVTFLVMYYYTTIQRKFAANLLSWTEGIIIVVPVAYFLSKIFGLNGVWIAFILAEIGGFIVIFIYTKIICKNSGGKLNDVFLIENNSPNLLYDVSFQVDIENSVKISAEVIDVLKNDKIAENTALKVGVALEEMAVNISKINSKIIDVDIRIKSEDKKIIVAVRDNGIAFNPLEYQPKENFKFENIEVLKALSKNIKYNRVLSLNQTILEI